MRKVKALGVVAAVALGLALNLPAFAQAEGDQFQSSGNEGQYSSSVQGNTGTQTLQERDASAPTLQG
ncbi:MAG: hypothetical protein IT343_25070, partial [Candidatus Melainabacteria bacterium]|nr:hypothetical protein [Candidatus Melainabacteria bacterium]